MEGNLIENMQEFPELLDFIGLKKKKKVRFLRDDFDSFDSSLNEPANNSLDSISVPCLSDITDSENDLSFDLKKKKKKKINVEEASTVDEDVTDVSAKMETLSLSLNENDTDYSYEDLLTRVFAIMREKDPNRDVDNRKKLIMKPPQIIRIGTKKTSFVNFLEICKMVHRSPQHLQSFLLVELGTNGSVDGNNQLIIKGRFEQRQIENVLRRYIKEYVTCHTCRSPDTSLQKDTRLFFLQCESCGSRCSVASVKSGFQAVTSKRAAMRAKSS